MTQNKRIIINVLISAVAVAFILTLFYRERIVRKVSNTRQFTTETLWTKEAANYFNKTLPTELKDLLDNKQAVVVVDLRSRAEYAKAHIPTSKNIPMDELEARM